jgi:phosphatidylserine/phosphatidylglycerophosphate/cardiolipin synthase-like enzyme
MSDMSVKVLRSRWRTKIDRSSVTEPWLTRGGGEIVEVHDALVAAIRGAQRYIYIEDQFLGDHPEPEDPANLKWWVVADVMTGGLRLWTFSLLPELEAALSRGVKVILVGSGYADPGDLTPGPKNRAVHPELSFMATTHPANLAIWRIEQQTVHSKLMVIDDAFAAVGSANLQARSMIGIDHELHVAVIDALDRVKGLRKKLWREHLGVIGSGSPDFEAGLDDIADALGMWRSGWGSGGRWFTSGDPDSFTPATLPASGTRSQVVRAYVGPGATP